MAFAVSVNGERAKNVTREEFGTLEAAHGKYLAEKARWNAQIKRYNDNIKLFEHYFADNQGRLQPFLGGASRMADAGKTSDSRK
jgi:hypothetical protein